MEDKPDTRVPFIRLDGQGLDTFHNPEAFKIKVAEVSPLLQANHFNPQRNGDKAAERKQSKI